MTHKTFMATLLAAALAVATLTAAPARADSDTAKIITGLAALAIIGAAIAEANDDKDTYIVNRNYYRHGYQPRRVKRETLRIQFCRDLYGAVF